MVFDDPPVICGHRGNGTGPAAGHAENTLPSFQAAVAAGLRWVEVDARVNADRVLVSCHDPRVEDGRFVADLSTRMTDELGLMKLDDLLEDLPVEIGVDLDVKVSIEDALRRREDTTAALAADLVTRLGRGRPLLVSSFDPSAILIVRERLPEVPIGLVTRRGCPLGEGIAATAHLGAQVVGANAASLGLAQPEAARYDRGLPDVVQVAHAAGIEVLVWSATPAEEEQLVSAGVDCIVVDDVAAALARERARAGSVPGR
jgi:glycerophosphoryl diester phosphodiesterase